MKWQLQREAHARQDKVLKPDYREEFTLEGDTFDRGGKERPKLMPGFFFRGKTAYIKINVNDPGFKTDAQKFLERVLCHEMMFKVDRYTFKFDWGKKVFGQFNHLQEKTAVDTYRRIRTKLQELYAITIRQFRRAERETGGTEVIRDGRSKICYQFKSALIPANTVKLENNDVVFDIDFIHAHKKIPE